MVEKITIDRPVERPRRIDTINTGNSGVDQISQAKDSIREEKIFFSPVIKIDRETQTAILQFRDTTTGEVTKEYPSNNTTAYETTEIIEETSEQTPTSENQTEDTFQDFLA